MSGISNREDSPVMTKITTNDVKSFVHRWFAHLDRLGCEAELLDMLADDDLEMASGKRA